MCCYKVLIDIPYTSGTYDISLLLDLTHVSIYMFLCLLLFVVWDVQYSGHFDFMDLGQAYIRVQ